MTFSSGRRLTKARVKEMHADKYRGFVIGNDWESHGYRYAFHRHWDRGWGIVAGCRTWYSFDAMRDHYRPEWTSDSIWRYGWSCRKAERYRKEALLICASMRRAAKKLRIRL